MARRGMTRRRRTGRRGAKVSESIATYTRLIDLVDTGSGLTQTNVKSLTLDDDKTGIINEETQNRKILRISGEFFWTAGLGADQVAAAMFAFWAHPKAVTAAEGLEDFDPFAAGPALPTGDYEGRPTPRPFGRRSLVLSTPGASSEAQTISQSLRYSTKAERLIRPGWTLSAGLWTRASDTVSVRCTGVFRVVVAG